MQRIYGEAKDALNLRNESSLIDPIGMDGVLMFPYIILTCKGGGKRLKYIYTCMYIQIHIHIHVYIKFVNSGDMYIYIHNACTYIYCIHTYT